ncbi:MAG: hypothetical protein L6R39_003794 [Caloplaca ligustica]|nr:MAG: hypothetical protein L6R39_003794 [Caloplaca ligustica]
MNKQLVLFAGPGKSIKMAGASTSTDLQDRSFHFMTFTAEIRCSIYRAVLPYKRSRLLQPAQGSSSTANVAATATQNPKKEWLSWENVPNTCMALLRLNKKVASEARAVMYGERAVFNVTVDSSGTIFQNRRYKLPYFQPFPSSSNWQFTHHWMVDLRFHVPRHLKQPVNCGYEFDEAGVAVNTFNIRTFAALYEYITIMEGFVPLCSELAKVPDLKTLTIKLPCPRQDECYREPILAPLLISWPESKKEDVYAWVNKTYMSVFAHMVATCVKPESLKIIMVVRPHSTPCPQQRCLDYASALENAWKTWDDDHHYAEGVVEWMAIKERAMLVEQDQALRTLLFDVWRSFYFSDVDIGEKLRLMSKFCSGIERAIRVKGRKANAAH